MLLELARASEPSVRSAAIRALGRLERREIIPELLRHLPSLPVDTSTAIAQAFRGPSLPGDTSAQQVEGAVDFEYTIFGMVNPLEALDEIAEGDIITGITFEKEADK